MLQLSSSKTYQTAQSRGLCNLVFTGKSQKAAIREKERKKKKNSDKRSTGRKYKHKKDSENSTSTIDIRLQLGDWFVDFHISIMFVGILLMSISFCMDIFDKK